MAPDGNITPVSAQDDVAYRSWLANGGEGSYHEWVAQGKPAEVGQGIDQAPAGTVRDRNVKGPNNNLKYWASSHGTVPLSYDISRWAEYGLPSDGYFSRTITRDNARLLRQGETIHFGGREVDGFPDGAGFIGSAEELYPFTNAKDLQKALDIRYEPDFILEFQLKDTSRLQNLLEFDDPWFRVGGKTLNGQKEFNFPGISSDDIVNWRLRALKDFD